MNKILTSPTITHETAERLRRAAAAQGVSADDLLNSLLDAHETPLAGQRELNEMKKRLMHTISHEFRTPLAAIQSSSEILTRYADRLTDEQRTARLTNIRAQVHHLRGMLEKTEELLQANMEPPFAYKQPLKLETVLRDILAANDHPKVRHHVEGTPRPVHADAHLLRQMITNLLQNAVTYSPPGAHIEVFQYYASDTVYIAVKDEGMGISENDLKYVFEPFFRGDNADTVPGTGLGLSVVRHAVEAHDGDIFVYSALEQGTVVLVQLPYGESQSMSIGA